MSHVVFLAGTAPFLGNGALPNRPEVNDIGAHAGSTQNEQGRSGKQRIRHSPPTLIEQGVRSLSVTCWLCHHGAVLSVRIRSASSGCIRSRSWHGADASRRLFIGIEAADFLKAQNPYSKVVIRDLQTREAVETQSRKPTISGALARVCFWGQTGKHMLFLRFTVTDPQRTYVTRKRLRCSILCASMRNCYLALVTSCGCIE